MMYFGFGALYMLGGLIMAMFQALVNAFIYNAPYGRMFKYAAVVWLPIMFVFWNIVYFLVTKEN